MVAAKAGGVTEGGDPAREEGGKVAVGRREGRGVVGHPGGGDRWGRRKGRGQ